MLKAFHDQEKYIALCCIAPVIAAKVFGKKTGGSGIKITMGGDSGDSWPFAGSIRKLPSQTATGVEACEAFGNKLQRVNKAIEYCVDKENRIYTVPWYSFLMQGTKIAT